MTDQIFKRSDDVVRRQVAGEVILVPIRGNVADMQRLYSLDAVGDVVWEQLAAACTVETLLDVITDRFRVAREQAQVDLLRFLESLVEQHLVAPVESA